MPYITQSARQSFIDSVHVPATALELNFGYTILARAYLEAHGETYQVFNDILGALEACKLELYRRQIAAYEDVKIQENGDVW